MRSVATPARIVVVCAGGMEPPFARAVAYGSYDGGLRELIHLLKYEQVRPAATVLGRMLAEAVSGLDSCWTRGPVMVVPVPLHARKLRQRGFNQSELIARAAIKQDAMTREREAAGWPCTPESWNGGEKPNPRPDLRAISAARIFVVRSPWPGRRKLPAAKFCWSMMSSPPAPRCRNALAYCAGRAHLKYMSLPWRAR